MFLTKKAVVKLILLAGLQFVVGSACMVSALVFACWQAEWTELFVLGILAYLLCVSTVFLNRQNEGVNKHLLLGSRLILRELKPAEFLRQYEALRNAPNLVINRPRPEILQMVALAHHVLNDNEKALAAYDEAIAVAGGKKEATAKLLKAAALFGCGRVPEAEALFAEARAAELNWLGRKLVDTLLKTDRAKALGEYETAMTYYRQLLERQSHRMDNLNRLMLHFELGDLCEKVQDPQNAVLYYQYCVSYGGETGIKTAAEAALERLR